ncbi:MAG: DUF4388 domain-containing protein [Myxococcales bacterium]
MSEGEEKRYWVRTEQGRVWGPFPAEQLGRLKGQITGKAQVALDGRSFRPVSEFPELQQLVVQRAEVRRAEPAARERAPDPASHVSPALRAMFSTPPQVKSQAPSANPHSLPPVAAPAAAPPAAPRRSPPVLRPQAPPDPVDEMRLPASGDLAAVSPIRLYALAALNASNGALELRREDGSRITIHFRRGTPAHVGTDDSQFSLLGFLEAKKVLAAEQAGSLRDEIGKSAADPISVLLQRQVIAPADVHRLIGEHALFLLDRALEVSRGGFTFQADAPAPQSAFPLGQKWTLLAEAVRRLDPGVLRARLGTRLGRPVVRSGGLGIGKVEELALNAQETRVYASIDGTRTADELLKQGDPGAVLRLLHLLVELKHLSVGDAGEAQPAVAPSPPPPIPTPVADAPLPPRPQPAAPRPTPSAGAPNPPPRPPPIAVARVASKPTPATPTPAASRPVAPSPPSRPTPVSMKPAPTFAAGPAGETPQAQLVRLRALLDRLEKASHFEALGLDRKATTVADVKRAFVLLARDLHPDTVTDPSQGDLRVMKERLFARVNEAAQILGDETRRKEYEKELEGDKKEVDVGRIFDAEDKFQRAEILIKARKYKEGLQVLDEAIILNPQEAEFYAWRGYARFLLAQDRKAAFEDCAAEIRKALKMVDRCIPAYLFLGQMQKVIGDQKGASASFQKVLQLDDRNVEAQRELRMLGKR